MSTVTSIPARHAYDVSRLDASRAQQAQALLNLGLPPRPPTSTTTTSNGNTAAAAGLDSHSFQPMTMPEGEEVTPTDYLTARLKAACYEYYTVQQSLLAAENQQLELQSVMAKLKKAIDEQQMESKKIGACVQDVQRMTEQEAASNDGGEPHYRDGGVGSGTTNGGMRGPDHGEWIVRGGASRAGGGAPGLVQVPDVERYLSQEQSLYHQIQDALEMKAATRISTEQLLQRAHTETQSIRLLEEAVSSQVSFNRSLGAQQESFKHTLRVAHQRSEKNKIQKQELEKRIQQLTKEEDGLKRTLKSREHKKEEQKDQLRERDIDTLRLRRDQHLSERLRLNEVEHLRELEATIDHLSGENRRLRKKVENQRKGRPELRQHQQQRGGNSYYASLMGDAPTLLSQPTAVGGDEKVGGGGEPSAGVSPVVGVRNETTRKFDPVPFICSDDADIFAIIAAEEAELDNNNATAAGAVSLARVKEHLHRRRVIEKFKDRNAALLQQVVSTMKMLQMQAEVPPGGIR